MTAVVKLEIQAGARPGIAVQDEHRVVEAELAAVLPQHVHAQQALLAGRVDADDVERGHVQVADGQVADGDDVAVLRLAERAREVSRPRVASSAR